MRALVNRIPRRYRLRLKALMSQLWGNNLQIPVSIKKTKQPKHFHFGTVVGSHRVSNLLEPALARFLVCRGHRVSVVLCDGSLTACLACSIWNQPSDKQTDEEYISPQALSLCGGCYGPALATWRSTGAEIYVISDGKSSELEVTNSFSEKTLIIDGVDYAEDVVAGCLRFLCKGTVESISPRLWESYSNATISIVNFYKNFIDQNKITLGFSVHGIYVPHGVINKIFKKNGIDFYNYNTSYRENRFYFTRNETYHKVLPSETHDELKLQDVSDYEIEAITQYLESRETGGQDWQQFNNEPNNKVKEYLQNRGFQEHGQIAVLFSNVVWDARLHFFDNTYDDMSEWVTETVEVFRKMPNRRLIIRVHPGEIISHSKSRERLRELPILQNLPNNIILIDAEEKISSYELARHSDLNLVYASKIAMELGRMNAPVITCGDAWVKNKTASITPKSKKEYLNYLVGDWGLLSDKYDRRNALAYAHYIFESKPLKFGFLRASSDRKSIIIDKGLLEKDIEDFEHNDLHRIENADEEQI